MPPSEQDTPPKGTAEGSGSTETTGSTGATGAADTKGPTGTTGTTTGGTTTTPPGGTSTTPPGGTTTTPPGGTTTTPPGGTGGKPHDTHPHDDDAFGVSEYVDYWAQWVKTATDRFSKQAKESLAAARS